jgi:hypothetical protein
VIVAIDIFSISIPVRIPVKDGENDLDALPYPSALIEYCARILVGSGCELLCGRSEAKFKASVSAWDKSDHRLTNR